MILLLVLFAAPLRRWLDQRFRRLFEEEAGLFREVAARIGKSAGRYGQLHEFLRFVEERAAESLGLSRVSIIAAPASDNEGGKGKALNLVREGDEAATKSAGDGGRNGDVRAAGAARPTNVQSHYEANVPGLLKKGGATATTKVEAEVSETVEDVDAHARSEDEQWAARVLALETASGMAQIEDEPLLSERGWEVAYALRRDERVVGLMLVDAAPEALTYEVRSSLELLAGQVAIAIEDSRLVEENVRLERRIAQSERLAALGRMAATVAHEVKNPLSAIKSIAQVLREDDYLKREYARDLELIVGETDRLSRSVTQMLSFARTAPQADEPRRAGELLDSVQLLFQKEAAARGVSLKADFGARDEELDGAAAASLRDALTNLLLNALHATPTGGRVSLSAVAEGGRLTVSVADTGPGVAPDQRERIWEPFYTTKQRGTGLGLAIVRKRIEEVGGHARLAPSRPGEGARFELTLPLRQ